MRRRDLIAGLLLAATMGPAQAQRNAKIYRIAIVDPVSPVTELTEAGGLPYYSGLFEELRQLGYLEGHNLLIERFSGGGRAERNPELARDVVRRNPELIFAVGTRMVLDLKAATTTIPIVGMVADPVNYGVVSSLARPGGNIPGLLTIPAWSFTTSVWSS
jgi:putative tryptophan/tyrosine transport system substrate-binding protein